MFKIKINLINAIYRMLYSNIRIIILSFIISCYLFSDIYSEVITNESDKPVSASIWFAEWFNDSKSAFSFSFDDGFVSQYENVRPILNDFDYNGTFYVLPPFLTDSLPGIWRYGTWPMFTEMSAEGHEIGSHTMNHLHLPALEIGDTTQEGTILYELYQSRKMINARLPDKKCITLAYPYAEHNHLIDSLAAFFYESARADGLIPNNSYIQDSLWHQLRAIEVIFDEPRATLEDDLEELQYIKDWIDSSINNRGWGILLAHEVVPQDSLPGLLLAGSYEPYSNEWFNLLCEWIDSKSMDSSVWIETVANVTRFIKERTNAVYTILSMNELNIQFTVEDGLNDEIFNFPISVYIEVPDTWEFAVVSQENNIDTLEVFNIDSGKVILANVLPDNNLINVEKMIIDRISNGLANLSGFRLEQNYPNPFNPVTTIKYYIPNEGNVKLTVYDILGNKIEMLVNEFKSAGTHSVKFNANGLASGVYFYTLSKEGKIKTRKMLITK